MRANVQNVCPNFEYLHAKRSYDTGYDAGFHKLDPEQAGHVTHADRSRANLTTNAI